MNGHEGTTTLTVRRDQSDALHSIALGLRKQEHRRFTIREVLDRLLAAYQQAARNQP